ncbi:MAG: tRNA preQ1(34) S-adenosylmethionine ribosyltransferase-isomerase QueA [Candidatus Omnitrophota bacterium]
MQLSDFDYQLPAELIAQYPLKERDSARLLVLERQTGKIRHSVFKEIGEFLHQNDLLALNDTKVVTCRLKGKKRTGGRVELLLISRKQGLVFRSLIQPSRTKVGEKIFFDNEEISAIVSAKNEITFYADNAEAVYNLGVIPLPPYIKREPEELDVVYYQTVYAAKDGAIASPTAGLHFTPQLLEQLKSRGIGTAYLTLQVGYGTFKPVKIEDITAHKMEPENFCIPDGMIDKIKVAKDKFARIVAVGTTSLRALETFASSGAKEGETSLFIYPGYKFKLADCLLTNFHLPRTTLFMLACAFGGEKIIKQAYQEAIKEKYRFYSYGDAMLIL